MDGWISVEDRLPDKDGEYIVYAQDEFSSFSLRIWDRNVVVAGYYKFGKWFWTDAINEYEINEIVTHWMPLPEPLREEEQRKYFEEREGE